MVVPLTKFCSPAVVWNDKCQHAFNAAKSAPYFSRPFKLELDASATGISAVQLQGGEDGMCHPVSYFSVKHNKHQLNYSTIEKEMLAMLLALLHFEVYVGSSSTLVIVLTNPLVFLEQMYNHNQQLMCRALLSQGCNIEIR